ncbi:MAG: YeeE/YedE family protein, partial [Planctomycetales bacterium]|nr:YeeE/YedE family protein [Planctomycetales bacterium]
GAGVSGGAIFSVTAWAAVFCMWIGAVVTHRILLSAERAVANSA